MEEMGQLREELLNLIVQRDTLTHELNLTLDRIGAVRSRLSYIAGQQSVQEVSTNGAAHQVTVESGDGVLEG